MANANIFNQVDSSYILLQAVEKYAPEKLANGSYSRETLTQMFDAFGVSARIDLMIRVLKDLEVFDELLAPITIVSPDATKEAVWFKGSWGEDNRLTRKEAGEMFKRTLTIKAKDYAYGVELNKETVVRAEYQAFDQGRGNSAYVLIDQMIANAVDGYKSLLRRLALTALTVKPIAEDPTIPCFYRNTTTFAEANKVVPPPHGTKTFETAVSQEHYIFDTAPSLAFLRKLRNLIVDKGGNPSAIAIIATEETWQLLEDNLTADEFTKLEKIMLIGAENIFPSALTQTMNITIANSDGYLGYWIALDMSKKILQKRIDPMPNYAGVNTEFDTLSNILAENSGASRAEVNARMFPALIRGEMKLSVKNVGFGIISPASGAVGYTKAGATSYVNPNWQQ